MSEKKKMTHEINTTEFWQRNTNIEQLELINYQNSKQRKENDTKHTSIGQSIP